MHRFKLLIIYLLNKWILDHVWTLLQIDVIKERVPIIFFLIFCFLFTRSSLRVLLNISFHLVCLNRWLYVGNWSHLIIFQFCRWLVFLLLSILNNIVLIGYLNRCLHANRCWLLGFSHPSLLIRAIFLIAFLWPKSLPISCKHFFEGGVQIPYVNTNFIFWFNSDFFFVTLGVLMRVMINQGPMNDSSIRQELKNLLLLLEELFDLLTLEESRFSGLDWPSVTNEDNWLHNHNKNQVVEPNSIISYVNMANLDRTVDEQLKTHQDPMNVEQYDCQAQR